MNSEKFNSLFPLPPFEPALAEYALLKIIRSEITRIGLRRAVLGVSGGIDSALSLALVAKALGADNVTAVLMPYRSSSPASLEHGRLVCDTFGVRYVTQEITPMVEPYFISQEKMNEMRRGNIMARMRMIVLYDYSAKENALVIGTSNKTEILLGYSTLWGDMASAVNPLGDLYKCQVRALSAFLGVPAPVIDKAPSADLWEGQSDEAELNLTYDMADRILYQHIDLCRSQDWVLRRLAACDGDIEAAQRIFRRIETSQFKRNMPIIAKISHRTVNREFRQPRDWNV